jgi:aminoglycoside phosphotransferase (APT) family kinase protein
VPDKPTAEIRIDESLVRHLVETQVAPHLPGAQQWHPSKYAEGWDCEVWRLGSEIAMRLPRRAIAAPLIRNEWRSLALLAPAIAEAGVRVPAPLVHGVPDARYPWDWSVVPWIDGVRGLDIPRDVRAGWAEPLASALGALHTVAPHDHPSNPVRGRALSTRADAFAERMTTVRESSALTVRAAEALEDAWTTGLHAPDWNGPALWIHGDLHPGNLIADGPTLRGIVDFGDVTGGDPAYDLAIAWLAFERRGRERFVAATGTRYDAATWSRARAWAASVAVILLVNSDDSPVYAQLGREVALELAEGA